jgi:hypothetical protein
MESSQVESGHPQEELVNELEGLSGEARRRVTVTHGGTLVAVSEPSIPPPPADHGGFQGRYANLFDHAFGVCYDVSYRGITADPPGSGPPLYSATGSAPIAAIGSANRLDDQDMHVVEAGCLAGQNTAFATTGFTPPTAWNSPDFPPWEIPEHHWRNGTPTAYRATLAQADDVEIQITNVFDLHETLLFDIAVRPVGRATLRPEHRSPLPHPLPSNHPDAFCLTVTLPDGTTLHASDKAQMPRDRGGNLALASYHTSDWECAMAYGLLTRLHDGRITFSCDWPAAKITGSIHAPIAALRARP